MRLYAKEVYDIEFKDFDGIGEILEAVYELDVEQRKIIYQSIVNHIRIIMRCNNTMAFGTFELSDGSKFVRVMEFDLIPDNSYRTVNQDEDKKYYIEVAQ